MSGKSIGLDSYIDDFWTNTTSSNYPPYNLVQVNNVESRLEIALAGFKKKEVKVYTEFGKLHVEGKKEESKDDATIVYQGLFNVPSIESGRSPMIQRLDRSALPMDSLPWNWEK
ncbi:MAG: hypothetical protein CM15mV12_1210 [uncultured marine virus]|nr:MAG: hypothetical protein CM15mV12_1210 [uncultured marine virus]